jgi:2-polyprenyl-3-methyl-5-hydroxy-6-metoxy-1,4-benzoquinol methylase
MNSCRFCTANLTEVFADLGMSPLSNAFVPADRASQMEPFFPLTAYVCTECLLVQVPEFEAPENIFSATYAYFSSFSDTWLAHVKRYVEAMADRYAIGADSRVVEIASNDGYLLQYFVERGVPVLGVEPAANCAAAAEERGVKTLTAFFSAATARKLVDEGKAADLLLGNNVLAHVPDLNDFVEGLRVALKPRGVITMEFPHLLHLIEESQFDTIYHEHFSYFSFLAVQKIFAAHGLTIFDVEELPTHGGSLRIHAQRTDSGAQPLNGRVEALLEKEREAGMESLETYRAFAAGAQKVKRDLLRFLIDAKEQGKRVAGYGAPAKGNTLLNYCGVRTDLLSFTVDRSPHKQGTLLPGTRIPVRAPQDLLDAKPDYVLILPWNIRDEIVDQMGAIRDWGGRFVVPIPRLQVLD